MNKCSGTALQSVTNPVPAGSSRLGDNGKEDVDEENADKEEADDSDDDCDKERLVFAVVKVNGGGIDANGFSNVAVSELSLSSISLCFAKERFNRFPSELSRACDGDCEGSLLLESIVSRQTKIYIDINYYNFK